MTALDRDDEFEAFLKSRTILPDGDDKLEPPSALDEIVMNRAREAIHARQQPTRAARWATPVALAATILLCLSIALNVRLNTNRPTAAGSALARSAQEASSSTGTISAAAPSPAPPPAAAAPPTPPAAAAPETAPFPASAPAGAARESARTRAWERQQSALADRNSNVVSQARLKASKPALAGTIAAPAATLPPDVASNAVGSSAAHAADSDTTDPSTARAAGPGAGRYAGPPAAPAPDTASAAEPPPDAAPAESFERQQPAAAAKSKAASASADHPQDPKVWLQQIDALRAQGKTAQADAEMQRFRAAFPGYTPKTPGT